MSRHASSDPSEEDVILEARKELLGLVQEALRKSGGKYMTYEEAGISRDVVDAARLDLDHIPIHGFIVR